MTNKTKGPLCTTYAQLMGHGFLHSKVNKQELFNPQVYHQGKLEDYSLNHSSNILTGASTSLAGTIISLMYHLYDIKEIDDRVLMTNI